MSLVIAGCAAIRPSQGDQLLRDGNPAAAAAAYRTEASERPADARVRRNLGIALLRSGDVLGARTELRDAVALDPGDGRALFFLAQAYEAIPDLSAAIDAYRRCASSEGIDARTVHGRIQQLSREHARLEIREALRREDALTASPPAENTLAVPDFVDPTANAELVPLRKALAATVITDLARIERLRLVERARLDILQREIELGTRTVGPVQPSRAPLDTPSGLAQGLHALHRPGTSEPYFDGPLDGSQALELREAVRRFQSDSGLTADGLVGPRTLAALDTALERQAPQETQHPSAPASAEEPTRWVDPATAPRVGRLLGAAQFLQGTFVPLEGGRVQIDATLLRARSGQEEPVGPPLVGPTEDVLRLEKRLVHLTLDALGIVPSEEERRRIDRLPTESFDAFLAYGRGLALEDAGDLDGARSAYEEAVLADPGFTEALDAAAGTSDDALGDVESSVLEDATAPVDTDAGDELGKEILGDIGTGPLPDEGDPEVATDDTGDGEDLSPSDPLKVEETPRTIPGFPPPPPGVRR